MSPERAQAPHHIEAYGAPGRAVPVCMRSGPAGPGRPWGIPTAPGVPQGPLPPSSADAGRPPPTEMLVYCRVAQKGMRRDQTGGTERLQRGGPATGSLLTGPAHLYTKFAPLNRPQHGGRQALFFNYALKLHTEQIP